jgi:hypothetical protein
LTVWPRKAFVVMVLGVLPVVSCGGDHDAEPTIPSVDFTPRLVVVVTGADGLAVEPGGRPEGTQLSPASVPSGSVIEVRNEDSRDHRITAGTTIDTGVMRPGDNTTVVMTTEGDTELRDRETGATLVITVTPRADER